MRQLVSHVIFELRGALNNLASSLPASHPTHVDALHGRIILGKDLVSSVETSRQQRAAAWGSIAQLVGGSAPVAEIASGPFPIDSAYPFIAASHFPSPQQLAQVSLVGAVATGEAAQGLGNMGIDTSGQQLHNV